MNKTRLIAGLLAIACLGPVGGLGARAEQAKMTQAQLKAQMDRLKKQGEELRLKYRNAKTDQERQAIMKQGNQLSVEMNKLLRQREELMYRKQGK